MNQSSDYARLPQQKWEQLLKREQTKSLYGGFPIAVLGNVFLALLLIYVQLDVVSHQVLAIWGASLGSVLLLRVFHYREYVSHSLDLPLARLLIKFRLSVLATGIVWGASGIWLFPAANAEHQFFVAFVLAGLTAAAVTSLAMDKLSAMALIFPSLLPITCHLLFENTQTGYAMAAMVTFFMIYVAMSSIRLQHDMHESVRLRVIAGDRGKNLSRQQALNEIIAGAQAEFIDQTQELVAYENLISKLLALTDGQFGSISLIDTDKTNELYFKNHAVASQLLSFNELFLYKSSLESGRLFQLLEARFKWSVEQKVSLIINGVAAIDGAEFDLGTGGDIGGAAVSGYLSLLAVPILYSGRLVALLLIIKKQIAYFRPDQKNENNKGFTQGDEVFLQPLSAVVGQLVNAAEINRAHARVQKELAYTYDLMERSNAVALIGTWSVDFDPLCIHWSSVTKSMHEVAEDYVPDIETAINFYKEGEYRDTINRVFNQAVSEGIGFDEELVIVTLKGNERWVRTIGVPEFKHGVCQRVYGTFQDITEAKRIERVKNEFVSTVSHELRTPLTSISASLGVMRSGKLGDFPQPIHQLLDIAFSNSLRLTHLINDLLDMDKLVAGEMHFDVQPQNIMASVKQALISNKAYAEQYGVFLCFEEEARPENILVDKQRLQQVLANLLSNAIKFSPAGGVVRVELAVVENYLRISVVDQGPGIALEFRGKIFQKFSQADSSDTRQKGGTGLGLAITRELVERMNGRIDFLSVEGQGANFFCEFPIV